MRVYVPVPALTPKPHKQGTAEAPLRGPAEDMKQHNRQTLSNTHYQASLLPLALALPAQVGLQEVSTRMHWAGSQQTLASS